MTFYGAVVTSSGTGVPVELLPAADAIPLCSSHAQAIGLRPAGTGLHLDRVLLVETALPWPKPATAHPRLKPLVPIVRASPVRTRMFASAGSDLAVTLFERTASGAVASEWRPADEAVLIDLISAIAEIPLAGRAISVPGAELVSSGPLNRPQFLVCVQGSHDICCGVQGAEFAQQLRESTLAARVHDVSHTGGHRFAPTLLELPSGRMWAHADLDLTSRIVANTVTADDLTTRCRGWWGVPTGPAQIAEIALAAAASPGPITPVPVTEVEPGVWSGLVDATVRRVRIEPGRTVPTIACGTAGGLPVKERIEYDWELL